MNNQIKKRQNENRLAHLLADDRRPVIEHVYELRRRLFYIAISVGLLSLLAYLVEKYIINALILPAGQQTFIYTSPIDGVNFLFSVCLYAGIVLSIPVVVYQFLRYIEPLFRKSSWRLIIWSSVTSGVLALLGIAFGYYIGLPATLHFLLHQFITQQIRPLLAIQPYLSFVALYMLGSALLFQMPLILVFINRIKPLKPEKLRSLKYERWIIIGAFILGGIMNPDPNLLNQAILVGPLIIMYQIGIAVIWLVNRRPHNFKGAAEPQSHKTSLRASPAHKLPTALARRPTQRARRMISDIVTQR